MDDLAQQGRTPAGNVAATALWRDACELPQTVADSLERADGHAELVALMAHPETRRVIVSGNGASWYAATSFWLAAIAAPLAPEVICVPAGMLARAAFPWRPGDLLLAFSSSGSLRDLVEAVESPASPKPFGLVTADTDSPLGRLAGANAMVTVATQRAVTHTQAYVGASVVGLELLARLTEDSSLRGALRRLPEQLRDQTSKAASWADELDGADDDPARAALCFSTGFGWPAALETALMLKEVAGIPAEGEETREGATSGMYALGPGQLVVGLEVGADPLAEEAALVCARRGATVRMIKWPTGADPRTAAAVQFLFPLALSIVLAQRQGLDPDQPGWYAAYLATARRGEATNDPETTEPSGCAGPTTTEEN